MSVFRTKVISLAASAVAFAGMAFGQAGQITCTATANVPFNPIELRSEGATELVSDTNYSCSNTTATNAGTQGTLTVNLSGVGVVAASSKPISNSGAGATEATLILTNNIAFNPGGGAAIQPAGTSFQYQGVISGTSINFNNVNFPQGAAAGNFSLRIANVRVNVIGSYSGQFQPVFETIFVAAQGLANFTSAANQVGVIRNGLSVSGNGIQSIGGGSSSGGNAFRGDVSNNNPNTLLVCGSVNPAFAVTVGELFAGAFKTQVPAGGQTVAGGEQGSFQGANNIGTANSGTRIKFVFAGIPQGATIQLPIAITNGGLTVQLIAGTETSAGFTVATSNVNNQPNLFNLANNATATTPGTVTAIYEVTTADLNTIKSFNLVVTVNYNAGAVALPAGPITITTSYAPSPAARGTALPSQTALPTVPYFDNTGTTLNGPSFGACQTTLLFPFVTNQGGFETGLVIANTSKDNLGNNGASVAGNQTGACTFNFYGSTGAEGGTAPATATAVNFPKASLTPTTIAPGTTHAETVTSVLGSSFQGYAIATCPFIFAQGFGYIIYGVPGANNTAAMGYTARLINANRQSSFTTGTVAASNNNPEGRE